MYSGLIKHRARATKKGMPIRMAADSFPPAVNVRIFPLSLNRPLIRLLMLSRISARFPPLSLWIMTETAKNLRSGQSTRPGKTLQGLLRAHTEVYLRDCPLEFSAQGVVKLVPTICNPPENAWPARSDRATRSSASGGWRRTFLSVVSSALMRLNRVSGRRRRQRAEREVRS